MNFAIYVVLHVVSHITNFFCRNNCRYKEYHDDDDDKDNDFELDQAKKKPDSKNRSVHRSEPDGSTGHMDVRDGNKVTRIVCTLFCWKSSMMRLIAKIKTAKCRTETLRLKTKTKTVNPQDS